MFDHSHALISARNLSFTYPDAEQPAIDGLNLEIRSGEYVALLGSNGSGKSTFLKLVVGLLKPSGGELSLRDAMGARIDPSTEEGAFASRKVVGLVLQNADDQIVGTVAEEDVAFGPENLGLGEGEIERRVTAALGATGLEASRRRPPQFLSGGEKQRLAIAGALAIDPPALALDEAASMIDPEGREVLLDLLDGLVAAGRTVIHVTHSLQDASRTRRAIVLHRGRLVFDGTPAELFAKAELEEWGFRRPEALRAAQAFLSATPELVDERLDPASFATRLAEGIHGGRIVGPSAPRVKTGAVEVDDPSPEVAPRNEAALAFSSVSHDYLKGTAFTARGISDVSFSHRRGRSLALVGATGSGKSTILRHANAVLLPSAGSVRILGADPRDPDTDLRELRLKSVLSVQNPEAALFERYAADDVAYGPRNKGLSGKALAGAVRRAMDDAGLPYAIFRDRDTRALSGGEKRRLALAGVFAIEGELVLLDEPTAALDGESREHILDYILSLPRRGISVVATTHSMDEAARFDVVGVVREGRLVAFGPPREIFGPLWDASWEIGLPWAASVGRELTNLGIALPEVPLNAEELIRAFAPDSMVQTKTRKESVGSPAMADEPMEVQSRGDTAKKRKAKRRRGTGIEFFRNATLGQFLDRPSSLRNLGANWKLAGLFIVAILSVTATTPIIPLALLAGILVAGGLFARVGPGYLLRALIPALPYLAIVIFIQLLFTWPDDTSRAILTLGPISVTSREIHRSYLFLSRIASLMALFSLFSATTPISESIRAASGFLKPLGRVGIPVREFSLIVGIALRFVPVLVEEAERIAVAQLSRGGGYAGKGRIRAALAMTVPLFLRALERSEALGVAMELRLFSGSRTPSSKDGV